MQLNKVFLVLISLLNFNLMASDVATDCNIILDLLQNRGLKVQTEKELVEVKDKIAEAYKEANLTSVEVTARGFIDERAISIFEKKIIPRVMADVMYATSPKLSSNVEAMKAFKILVKSPDEKLVKMVANEMENYTKQVWNAIDPIYGLSSLSRPEVVKGLKHFNLSREEYLIVSTNLHRDTQEGRDRVNNLMTHLFAQQFLFPSPIELGRIKTMFMKKAAVEHLNKHQNKYMGWGLVGSFFISLYLMVPK